MGLGLRRAAPVGLKSLVGLAGLGLVVLASGDENGVFDASKGVLFWSAVTVGVVTFLDGLIGAIREYRGGQRWEAEARMQKVLVGFILEVSKETGVDIEFVGASLFRPGWRVRRVGGETVPRVRRVLVRVMRFRVQDDSQPSKVARVRGKGAVGECWESGRIVPRLWHEQAQKYGKHNLSRAEFELIPVAQRDQFTFEEFRGIAHKYSEVLAAPILSGGGDVLGVLSVDVSVKAGKSHSVLDTPGVRGQAEAAAMVALDDLKRLYPLE